MAAKFKVGDEVVVPNGTLGARPWWVGKPTVIRVVFEEEGLYEVLFQDAEDFDHKLPSWTVLDPAIYAGANPIRLSVR